ncbi:MAG: site-2 protease family protein [Candidatus Uhrbacteria bacterium]|nr:site-2 protease family protein [Candidatus Uhrbacteria bacterium]
MFLTLLFSSPPLALAWIIAILFSLTVHEFSHGLMAKVRGDLTAEREGRLTLNPLAHLDVFGFIPLLLFGFGWAKPVPFNPYNLKNPKWDSVLIALAGPASNLIIAIVCSMAFRYLVVGGILSSYSLLSAFLFFFILLNLFLMLFNIIPIEPLDGSKLFFALFDAPKYEQLRRFVFVRGPQMLMFAVFISLLTNIDIFFFISRPAYAICHSLTGTSCEAYQSMLFSSL